MKTLRVYAKQLQAKNGGTFFAYKLKVKNGEKITYYDVRGKKTCTNLPRETGYFLLQVEDDKISLQEGKYPVLWLEQVANCYRDVDYEAKVKAMKQEKVNEIVSDNLFD